MVLERRGQLVRVLERRGQLVSVLERSLEGGFMESTR